MPLTLLLASGVMASGGGLPDLDSMEQITSGPPLPDNGLRVSPESTPKRTEIVAVDLPEPSLSKPPARAPRTPAPNAPPAPVEVADSVPVAPREPARRPSRVTFEPKVPDTGRGDPPLDVAPIPAPEPPSAAPRPVENLLEATRGLGDSLPKPLQPITNNILNLLLGPPAR